MKVEPEAEDDAGRRNEDAGDDVFQIRGSKTLADLRVVVEKYIVRPWEENKEEHEEVSWMGFAFHCTIDRFSFLFLLSLSLFLCFIFCVIFFPA